MRYAVIMAGGGGTRLWPASRRLRPKQFLPLGTRPGETLIAATTRRLGPLVDAGRTIVVTAAPQVPEVRRALPGVPAENVVAEPVGRNTAAALGLAAVHLLHRDRDAVMAALPADQLVTDEDGFRAAADQAFALAEARDAIVTIGIRPTRPDTGFGYLQPGEPVEDGARVVARFVEKPDRPTAERYVRDGYLWNGGMFFLRARRLLAELERHLPETHAGLRRVADALDGGGPAAADEVTRALYPRLPSISIDYGVMERTTGILTVAGDFGWSDVGSWTALAEYRPADADGNVAAGALVAHDARDNVVVADDGLVVALVGVSGLVVVQAGDAVLVIPRERAQDVREAVRLLEERKLDRHL